MKTCTKLIFIYFIAFILNGFAESEVNYTTVGWTRYQQGMTPLYKGLGNFDYNPLYQGGAIMLYDSEINDNWKISLGAGVVFQNTAILKSVSDTTGTRSTGLNPHSSGLGTFPFLYIANAKYCTQKFDFTIGQFDHRYSSYNTNLGNYLLRGPVYPQIIYTDFEAVFPQIGLMGNFAPNENFKWDVLATFETEFKPLFDINLSSYLTGNIGMLEVGVGVNVKRAIEFNKCATSPSNFDATDQNNDLDACLGGDPFGTPGQAVGILNGPDKNSTGYFPEVTSGLWAIADSVGVDVGNNTIYDTTFFSSAGTKLMARVALNLSGMLPEYDGNQKDFAVYSEVALIGVKNYKHVYENRSERVPMMFGVAIPTMGFFSKLAFEVQYFKSPYPNNPSKLVGAYDPFSFSPVTFNSAFSPIPTSNAGTSARLQDFEPYDTAADNWKWSLYASKTVAEKIRFSGMFASDHWRVPNNNSVSSDLTVKPSQFYGSLKISYTFN